jgi:hypothetical protein
MKIGTRVVVRGLDPHRGEVGTYTNRLRGLLGLKVGLFEVTLDDGTVVRTSRITKYRAR